MTKFFLTAAAFVMIGAASFAYADSSTSVTTTTTTSSTPTFTERAKAALQGAADDIRDAAREAKQEIQTENAKIKSDVLNENVKIHTNLRRMHDAHIFNSMGQKVGEVEDVLVDPQGNVVAIAAEISGALDPERDVIIDMEKLTYRDGNYITSYTTEELKQRPRWKD